MEVIVKDHRRTSSDLADLAAPGSPTPGKRTASEELTPRAATSPSTVVQQQAASGPRSAPGDDDPFGFHLLGGAVQRSAVRDPGADGVHEAAARGIQSGGERLPYLDRIQTSFGHHHDVSQVEAHVGGPATEATAAMGAMAYATGNHVAFAAGPDLHTAAHEAAHVVQQRGGVQLKRGVGQLDDVYEQHADAVADAVVAGRSSAALLERFAGGGTAGAEAPLQMKRVTVAGGTFCDESGDGFITYGTDTKGGRGKEFIERGAQMSGLTFTPIKALTNASGQPAREVSLVQTTNSTVEDIDNPHAEDQPESMLDERRTEDGSAIDQQIYLDKGDGGKCWDSAGLLSALEAMAGHGRVGDTNTVIAGLIEYFKNGAGKDNEPLPGPVSPRHPKKITATMERLRTQETGGAPEIAEGVDKVLRLLVAQTKKINLEPRYAEERPSERGPLKTTKARGTVPAGTTGWPSRRDDVDGEWPGDAMLRDRPSHKVDKGHTLRGRELFEVAAMADGNKFVGSVRWGWKIDGQDPELDPAEIEKVDHGDASKDFYAASRAWNKMEVPDLKDPETKHQTIQLPPMPILDWTDQKLENDQRNVGGSFGEYSNILAALRRYHSVKTSRDGQVQRKCLDEIVLWCNLHLKNHEGQVRNDIIRELLTDIDTVLAKAE